MRGALSGLMTRPSLSLPIPLKAASTALDQGAKLIPASGFEFAPAVRNVLSTAADWAIEADVGRRRIAFFGNALPHAHMRLTKENTGHREPP